jgi:hypothetical protein
MRAVTAKVIKLGRFQGIRLPKAFWSPPPFLCAMARGDTSLDEDTV